MRTTRALDEGSRAYIDTLFSFTWPGVRAAERVWAGMLLFNFEFSTLRLHTPHFTLHTPHSTLHTSYFTLHKSVALHERVKRVACPRFTHRTPHLALRI